MTLSKNTKKVIVMVAFTVLFLTVYRFGAYIQLPFIDSALFDYSGESMFGFLDVFTGNALSNFSILCLGISPYITSSIVVQLLQMDIVPALKEWSEEGETGKQKLNQLTRYIALGLAFVQALTLAIGIKISYNNVYFVASEYADKNSPFMFVYLALVATAGTAFALWLAEKITMKGIGNGTSMLIVAGILASYPQMFKELGSMFFAPDATTGNVPVGNIIKFFVVVLVFILIIIAVVFMEAAQRKIPIQYANRPSAAAFRGKNDSNVPIKLNSASVIPVIFASTLMSLPTTIVNLVTTDASSGWAYWVMQIFSPSQAIGFVVYIALIFIFSFFYSFLQMNPETIAENLQKNNAYVPGVRPGEETASYISRVLFKITMVGATYLAIIAALPIILSKIFSLPASAQIGGTSIIIVVGVAVETVNQLKTQTKEQQYHGFMN